jgi:pimeloyl-ACP methyl ester carboxylesterase
MAFQNFGTPGGTSSITSPPTTPAWRLDLRGYNDSDKPEGVAAYRLEVLVEDVRGAIAALGHERIILVGHDWGGAIAWAFAYTYPELLQSLIVMNIPHPARFAEGLRTPQQLCCAAGTSGPFNCRWLPELALAGGRLLGDRANLAGHGDR